MGAGEQQALHESGNCLAFSASKAVLEHNRTRHCTGVASEVAANDEDGADLGDGPPEASEDGRENVNPCRTMQPVELRYRGVAAARQGGRRTVWWSSGDRK